MEDSTMPRFDVEQCWLNAKLSTGTYKVRASSKGAAINIRFQLNKHRLRVARFEYGDAYMKHGLYDLKVVIEEFEGQFYVAFYPVEYIELPPPVIDEAARAAVEEFEGKSSPAKTDWGDDEAAIPQDSTKKGD
jgi:hypothetical protein